MYHVLFIMCHYVHFIILYNFCSFNFGFLVGALVYNGYYIYAWRFNVDQLNTILVIVGAKLIKVVAAIAGHFVHTWGFL